MTHSDFVVHQTVHGYRAGHELLQTSRALPQATQRAMVVQSDLSGPSVVPGFEEYFSGYPLEEINSYVLARTWYAAEMARPGCVWTHSLLVAFADLAHIEDLSILTRVFQRPTLSSVTESTLPSLTVAMMDGRPFLASNRLAVVAEVLAALYSKGGQAIVLRSDTRDLEQVVFAVWSQQWPRLRRAFRFCTGALSARAHDGTPFDLLVAPASLEGGLRREVSTGTFVDEALSPDAFWLSAAQRTVIAGDKATSVFFSTYGADAEQPRSAWRGLFEVFQLVEQGSHLTTASDIVALLASRFPSPQDAQRLKREVLWNHAIAGVKSHDVLAALASYENPSAFDDETLQLTDRAEAVWQQDRNAAIQLVRSLLTARLGPLGEQILGALCENVDPNAAVELERTQPGVLAIIVSRSPRLANTPATWGVPLDRQREMLDALARIGDEAVTSALPAMLLAGTGELARDVTRAMGARTADAMLVAIDSQEELLARSLAAGWRNVLAEHPTAVVQWLHKGRASWERLALAVSILEPDLHVVRAVPLSVWLPAADGDVPSTVRAEDRLRVSAFLLALGLTVSEPQGATLIRAGYPAVYAAARNDSLPYTLWRWLDDHLPPVSWWRRWDRCERLSLGLVDRFAQDGWPLQSFIDAVEGSDAFAQALAVTEHHSRGRAFLRRLIADADAGRPRLTNAQRDELRRHN